MKRSLFAITLPWLALASAPAESLKTDVCIYGATPAGINAAIAAKQEGASVILIEPGRWVGGILGAGIKTMQDCPEPRAVGGLTKSRIFKMGNTPPLLRQDFEQWLKEERIEVIREQRVKSVEKDGTRAKVLHLEPSAPDENGVPPAGATAGEGKDIEAKVFIDASYEGDLMAKSGVAYTFGREAAAEFHEGPAGVGPATNWQPVSPYVTPGDEKSGLLPLVEADHGKAIGAADDYTQAYNFRFYVTSDETKRVEFKVPEGYSPAKFELVGRYVDLIVEGARGDVGVLKEKLGGIFPGWRNSGEYNYQRKSLVTMAPLGLSRFYQDGDWGLRSKIWREHQDYLAGLHHFMSTDPRVPAWFREETRALGLDRTMHPDTNGWPNQLYVRITRRMNAAYKLTHADVLNQTAERDGVGLALYGVDIYPVRRYAVKDPKTGQSGVATEGNMFIGGAKGTGHPYPVPYRSIVPKQDDCSNLLVPVCFSATHIAYASARMEPVFAVLGESAGVAAAQAVKGGKAVQEVEIEELQKRLLERGQIFEWNP